MISALDLRTTQDLTDEGIALLKDCPEVAAWEADTDPPRPNGRAGRRRTKVRYTGRGFLVVLLTLARQGRPLHLANVLRFTWLEMPEPQLIAVGMGGLVTAEGRAKLILETDGIPMGMRSEYKRFHECWRSFVDPVEPNLDLRGHGPGRLTNRVINAILRNRTQEAVEASARRHNLLHDRLNALVKLTLVPRTEGDLGDLVIDATLIRTDSSTVGTHYKDPDRYHGHDPDTGWWSKFHDGRKGWGYAIHLAQAIHSLYGREVPMQATAIFITKPVGGSTAAALALVDYHVKNDHGPLNRRRRRPQAVLDRGYTNLNGLAAGLYERGYDIVQDYIRKGLEDAGDPDPSNPPTKPSYLDPVSGAYLYQGRPFCPASLELIGRWTTAPRINPTTDAAAADPRWQVFEDAFNDLAPYEMSTNGSPRRLVTAGREEDWRMNVRCPARDGRVRCEYFKPSLRMSKQGHVTASPPDEPALCCTKDWTTLVLPRRIFKRFQKYLFGSYRWTDRYGGARSRNEGYHAELTKTSGSGAAFAGSQFETRGLASFGVLSTIAVMATNLRLAETWKRRVAANGGRPPFEDRVQWEAARTRNRERPDRAFQTTEDLSDVDFREDLVEDDDLED